MAHPGLCLIAPLHDRTPAGTLGDTRRQRMYEEFRIIDGKLHTRHSPKGPWMKVTGRAALAAKWLAGLSEADRLSVIGCFCQGCGVAQGERHCQCRNDE